ncbi:hypothetical protein [Bacillus sp. B4EP4a]|nr:hypothetical protein [Bacillus sp. B4EP4a]
MTQKELAAYRRKTLVYPKKGYSHILEKVTETDFTQFIEESKN